MTSSKRAFTLIELLVVVGMIAVILGALTTSITASQERARIQKATAEVKVITQAILAYENYARTNNQDLPTLQNVDADANSLDFLIGHGQSAASGGQIPATLMASLSAGGKMRDPWGTPYKVVIRSDATIQINTPFNTLNTGYFLPNYYNLKAEERL